MQDTHLRALGDLPEKIEATAAPDLMRLLEASVSQAKARRGEVTHFCPPEGLGVTPCCGLSPHELPRTDRITAFEHMVTCGLDL